MVCVLLIVGLCGCSNHKASDIEPITRGFKCNFSVVDSDLSGELFVNAEGDLSMIFKGPDIINNVGIRVKEESVIIEVAGLSERYSRADAPNDSPALYAYDAFISMNDFTPFFENDVISVSGKSKSGGFKALINGTGYITELHFDNIDTVLNFENHVITK